VWGLSPSSVWIAANGYVLHLAGDSLAMFAPDAMNAQCCYGTSDTNVWFASENALFDWNGNVFTPHVFDGDSLPDLRPIMFESIWLSPDGREIFTTTARGQIVHRKPNGVWEVQESGSSYMTGGLVGFSSTDLYAVSGWAPANEGFILHYDGSRWTKVAHGVFPAPFDTNLQTGIFCSLGGENGDSLYLSGDYIYKRNGLRWNLADAPCNTPSNHCGAYTDGAGGTWNNMWIVGDGGYILHFNGERWTTIDKFFDKTASRVLLGVLAFHDEVFLVGTDNKGGLILHGK
jgi:hypothetical protein